MSTSVRSCRSSGLTLIEVVAGLAIMGTLVAVALITSSAHLRQMEAAQRKHQATELLDRFFAEWSRDNFQEQRASTAAGSAGARLWTTESRRTEPVSGQEASAPIIRLVKRFQGAPQGAVILMAEVYIAGSTNRSAWGEVLVEVDDNADG